MKTKIYKLSCMLIISLVHQLIITSSFAQAPQGISHQAVIRNAANELVISSPIGIRLSILQGTAEGTVVYSETHLPTSNASGLISFVIGQGTVVSGVFAEIDWADGPYFLKTEVDPAGGTSYTITGISQMLSMPYAFYSETSADKLWSKNGENISYDQGNVGIGTKTPTTTLDVSGSANISGSLTVSNQIIQMLPVGTISMFAGSAPPQGYLFCTGQEISREEFPALFLVIGTSYGAGNGTTTFNLPDLCSRVPVGLSYHESFNELGKTGGTISHTLTLDEIPAHSHFGQNELAGNHFHSNSVSTTGHHSHYGVTESAGSHIHYGTISENGYGRYSIYIKESLLGSEVSVADNSGYHTHGLNIGSAGAHTHAFATNSTGQHNHIVNIDMAGTHTHSLTVSNTGGDQPHSNLQPYIVLNYIIKY